MIQVTGDGHLNLGNSSEVASGYIMKVYPAKYPARLNRECGRKRGIKDDSKV